MMNDIIIKGRDSFKKEIIWFLDFNVKLNFFDSI